MPITSGDLQILDQAVSKKQWGISRKSQLEVLEFTSLDIFRGLSIFELLSHQNTYVHTCVFVFHITRFQKTSMTVIDLLERVCGVYVTNIVALI